MQNFWEFAYKPKAGSFAVVEFNMPYRYFRMMGAPDFVYRDFKASTKDYFPSLQLSICRDSEDPQKGLYLSLKGHHNAASHNHLDVGNFVIFCDGKPIFIDAGVGTYSARTFNQERYSIWSMRSEYHNLPTVNGVNQKPGRNFAAKNAVFEEENGKLTMDLAGAYPVESELSYFTRSAVIEDGKAVVTDTVRIKKDGEVTFNLLCNCKPENVEKGSFTIHGKTVRFDERLSFDVDSPDCTWVETETIPASWNCEALYRIKLTAPLKANEIYAYTMEVCR